MLYFYLEMRLATGLYPNQPRSVDTALPKLLIWIYEAGITVPKETEGKGKEKGGRSEGKCMAKRIE